MNRIKVVETYSGNKVLDVGCSTGSYVVYLNEKGYDAYGCDILRHKEWNGRLKTRFRIADITKLPYKDKSFDTVLAFEVLEHLGDVDIALKELHRVTRKNIIISVPNCLQPPIFKQSGLAFHHWTDRTHKQFFTDETLRKIIEGNGFKITRLKFINPVAPELLALSGWKIHNRVTFYLGRFFNKLPFRKKYYMTLLVVAGKKPNE